MQGVRAGAVAVPLWLRSAVDTGLVRLRPDAVEIALPNGLVAVAGPNDLIVRADDVLFPLRREWFDRLFVVTNAK